MRLDSVASRPLSNTPTTVQGPSRSTTSSPIATLRNSSSALRPTISSRKPGVKERPLTIFISGRTALTAGSTPRTASPARAASSFRKRFTAATKLAVAAGVPSAARAMPGASLIVATASTSRVLENSPVAPARSTIARSLLPVASTASDKLRVNPKTERITATTPAMPTTMTLELPMRCGTLRRFIAVTEAICLNTLPTPRYRVRSTPRERVDDAEALRAQRRQRRADDGEHDGQAETHRDHGQRQIQTPGPELAIHRRRDDGGDSDAECGRDAAENHRLREHEAHDRAVAEPVGLQHRELGNAFANRLHHRIAGHEQQRKHHGGNDGVDEEPDVADLRDLRAQPILLALRLRLGGRIREQRVDPLRDLGRAARVVDLQEVERDRAVGRSARLVEVVVVDPELAGRHLARRRSIRADDLEVPSLGAILACPHRRAERNTVADLPAALGSEVLAYQRAVPGVQHRVDVLRLHLDIGIDDVEARDVDRADLHAVAALLVVACEEVVVRDLVDARHGLHPRAMSERQGLRDVHAAHRPQTRVAHRVDDAVDRGRE